MKEEDDSDMASTAVLHRRSTYTPTTTMLLVRGRRFRSSCPGPASGLVSAPPTAPASVRRTGEPKRRALIPISSRQTSRMLNNVDLDDRRVDFRFEDTHFRRRTMSAGPISLPLKDCCAHSTSSTDSSLDCSSSVETVSSGATSSGVHGVQAGPGPSDWVCLRPPPSRYSASSFGSSCSAGSEEDVWIPRKHF